MKVQTEITLAGYQAFIEWIKSRVQTSGSMRLGSWLFGGAVVVGMVLMLAARPNGNWKTYYWGFGFLCGVAFVYGLWQWLVKKSQGRADPGEGGYMLGLQEVEIDEIGIRARTAQHDAVFRWSLVPAPVTTKDHVFISVERYSAIIVPRRSFGGSNEFAEFVEEVRNRAKRAEAYRA